MGSALPEDARLGTGEITRNGQKRRTKSRTRGGLELVETALPAPEWDAVTQDWVTFLTGGHKPSTVRDYRSRIGIVRAWAESEGVTLGSFKARDLDRFLAKRQADGLADTSRRHDAIVCKAFLKWAFLRKYLRSNPLQGYEIPKAQSAVRVVPSAEDIGKLIEAVGDCWNVYKTDRARYTFEKARRFYAARDTAIIVGLLATGARISELLALRLEDWRPDLGEICFRQTKNGEPRRVPISLLWQPHVEAYLRARPRCDNPYLFVNADGGSFDAAGQPRPMPLNTWARAWKRYMERAGLSGWSRHNLRHFFGTHVAVDKSNLMLASAILGHKDLKTTKLYAHNSVRQMQEAFAAADPLKSIPILVNRRKTSRPKLL